MKSDMVSVLLYALATQTITTGPKGNGGNNKMGHGATARIVEFECSPRNHDEDSVTGFSGVVIFYFYN